MKIFKSLEEEYLQEGVYDPGIFKAYFLVGGPGSGKSFVTSNAFAGLGLKLVNSDDILTKYLNNYMALRGIPTYILYWPDL